MKTKERMTPEQTYRYLAALRRLVGKPEYQKCAYFLRELPYNCRIPQLTEDMVNDQENSQG